jgi:tetratricopeptide (TPR) repeat protein
MFTAKLTLIISFYMLTATNTLSAQDHSPADDLLKTADNFRSRSLPDSALLYYDRAAAAYKNSNETEKQMNAYNQAATMLNRQDKYLLAKNYLEKALAAAQSLPDPDNLVLATTYITLGVTYGAQNLFEESLDYHYKALEIRLRKLGKNHADIATSYGNIGNIYLRKKDFERSVEAHTNAKKIREKLFGKNGNEIAQSYLGLGNAYKELKDYKRSLKYYDKLLTNKITQLGEGHKDLARYYNNLVEVYSLINDKVKADAYKAKAISVENRSK